MSNTTPSVYGVSDIFQPDCPALRQAWFHDAEIESSDSHSIRWMDGFEIGFAYSDDTGSYGGYFAYIPDPLAPLSPNNPHIFHRLDIEAALELKQTESNLAYKSVSALTMVRIFDVIRQSNQGKAA